MRRGLSWLGVRRSTSVGRDQRNRTPSDPLARVTFGVITALTEELAAARDIFDDPAAMRAKRTGPGKIYFLAELVNRFEEIHVVAIASCFEMGTGAAVYRAKQMIDDCPNLRYVIMCGIAGAVPDVNDAESHVRLGDIVVSGRGGVIQHDLGKTRGDGSFECTADPMMPSEELLEVVGTLESDAHRGERPWKQYAVEAADRRSRWHRLPEDQDRLFAGDELVGHPPDSKREPGQPRVFQGVIASGSAVLRNADRRDELREEHNARAVDMESAGVAFACRKSERHFIAVRGTCDYCDEHKHKQWQDHAAIIAAAYVRALIEATPYPEAPIPAPVENYPSAGGDSAAPSLSALGEFRRTPNDERRSWPVDSDAAGPGPSSGVVPKVGVRIEESGEPTDERSPGLINRIADAERRELGSTVRRSESDVLLVVDRLQRLRSQIELLLDCWEIDEAASIGEQVVATLREYHPDLPRSSVEASYLIVAEIETAKLRLRRLRGAKPDTTRARKFVRELQELDDA